VAGESLAGRQASRPLWARRTLLEFSLLLLYFYFLQRKSLYGQPRFYLYGGQVFHLDADISLSTDPVITFGFVPHSKGQMKVVARDSSNATFDHSFDVPGMPSG